MRTATIVTLKDHWLYLKKVARAEIFIKELYVHEEDNYIVAMVESATLPREGYNGHMTLKIDMENDGDTATFKIEWLSDPK
jgi:hypothetical protein